MTATMRILPLPDASRLPSMPRKRWLALGRRLREIGVTPDALAEIDEVAGALPDAARPALRHWRLRRSGASAATAMRLLVFSDAVPRQDAARALGRDLVEELERIGLVEACSDSQLSSPFNINLVNDLYVLCDDLAHGGDAVMGAAHTTSALAQAAYPYERGGRVLDLGCGAGTIGLLFAPQADCCVCTDVNPRALVFARANAAMNDIANVDMRQGDLFEPVRSEAFDVIASQPPFVARPSGVDPATFLHGGERGDELALRLLAALPDRLALGGRACLLIDWPLVEDGPLERRLRAALASERLDVLVVELPRPDLDDYCARYASAQHPTYGPAFGKAAVELREHLERLGVSALQPAVTVIARPVGRNGFTARLDASASRAADVTSERIDAVLETHDLLARGEHALRDAQLRVAGTAATVERTLGSASSSARLRLSPSALVPEVELSADALLLVSLIDEHASVAMAARAFAEQRGLPPGAATETLFLSGVRQALAQGLLEPVRPRLTAARAVE